MSAIAQLISGFRSRCRRWWLARRGVQINGAVWLREIELPRQAHRIALGDGAALDRGVTLLVSGAVVAPVAIHIGARVYVNRHTIVDACDTIEIGDDCMIGPFCYITDHDHQPGEDGCPASGPLVSRPVRIQSKTWIGAHVTILKGVTIGAGAIVGAGSVVTRDVPPGAVFAGNPARALR